PRIDNDVRVTLSVIDRLIDLEPEMSSDPPRSRAKGLRELKQAVQRDLEWLLNTRQIADGLPPELTEVNRSLAAYGLPDFSAFHGKGEADHTRRGRAVESAIRIFEPRLEDVTVTIEPPRDTERLLRFRIDARLKVDPAPEPITFDTLMQLDNGQYIVRED